MSNLALGQTVWNKTFRRFGWILSNVKKLRDLERFYDGSRLRTQVFEINDTLASTSAWTLAGVVIGTNTNEDGQLFVRITDESPGAGQATVNLYKTTGGGGGDLVATGSAANGAVATLTASNSSGLTGTVTIGTVGASESNDLHRLLVFPDAFVRSRSIFDGTSQEDGANKASIDSACSATRSQISSAIVSWTAMAQTFLRSEWARIMKSSQDTTQTVVKDTREDEGAITSRFAGLLEDGRANMADETTPAAQTLLKRTVTPGSASFHASNTGTGTMATPTMEEWAGDGLIRLSCFNSDTIPETFTVSQIIDATGKSIVAAKKLTLGRVYADPTIGIRAMTLLRAWTFPTGSTNDVSLTQADWSLSGETADFTNDGIIYLKVTGSTGAWVITGYSSSTYDSAYAVFTSAAGAAGATVVLSASNGSGITGTGEIGSAPTTGNTASINLKFFKTARSADGKADEVTVDVVVTRGGEFQERLVELFGYALNSAASGETIDDSYVSAGTFPPYEVADA